MLTKIISGGQTGADLGALDAAISLSFPHGGWMPADKSNELGPIAPAYLLTPVAKGGYATRMMKNVQDSDGTLIFYRDDLEGGTAHTLAMCMRHEKPFKLVDLDTVPPQIAVEKVLRFIVRAKIQRLNVAGPRASKDPLVYSEVREIMTQILKSVLSAAH